MNVDVHFLRFANCVLRLLWSETTGGFAARRAKIRLEANRRSQKGIQE
jgi:hypothetical protein